MKILDKYILKSFVVTFISVFVILFFIFILQTVWLFIAELAGKDLDLILVIKFLMFAMPRIVPLVLPLSVLLASIMTFGNLAENYEFAAMKSAGISLQRSMRVLIYFICFLSVIAFYFANNVIPYAEYKFINFRKDIAQMKPAMAIAEGQFSDIGNYNIKVDKKSGENGNILTGITIHKKSYNFEGNKTVIKAKNGELISNENSNILKLILNDGYYYEDVVPKRFEERKNLPFAKSAFKKYVFNLDLSKLNQTDDQGEISNTNTMLNLSELNYTLDSLNKNYKKDILSFSDNIRQRNGSVSSFSNAYADTTFKGNKTLKTNLLSSFKPLIQRQLLNTAKSNTESLIYSIDGSKTELESKQKTINYHWIALYDKFVIAYACLLMFFIGAPLGAIIRKGGLGLPIVFAVLIFIIYHFINTFGKKVAQENGISPFLGCWLSSFVLTPFAVLLTYRATNDIGGMFNIDFILAPIQKFFTLIFSKFDTIKSNNKNKQAVLKENSQVVPMDESLKNYQRYATIALILNLISFVFFFIAKNNTRLFYLTIIQVVLIVALFYFIYISQKKIIEIGKSLNKEIEPGIAVAMVIGFPLYFLIYFYNSTIIKNSSTHNRS